MTLAKRLLLGTAAAFVATSGAHAADLGLPVAPAVEYVQICSIGGFTGFLLPGGDVCFDISGYARGQLTWTEEVDPFIYTGTAATITVNSVDGVAGSANVTVGSQTIIVAGVAADTNAADALTAILADAGVIAALATQGAAALGLNSSLLTIDAAATAGSTAFTVTGGANDTDAQIAVDPAAATLAFTAAGASFAGSVFADGDTISGLNVLNVDGNNDENLFEGNARLNFDARTMTEYGLLRGFVRLDGENGTAANVDRAFVQLNIGSLGFTAGRADSVFDPVFTGYGSGAAQGLGLADQAATQFSVNAAVGNGVTLSLSVEDDDARADDVIFTLTEVTNAWTLAAETADAGNAMPDLVAAIRVDQAWGSAKLAGALAEINPATAGVGSEWGYAISASAELNMPVGVGSTFGITGIYADGAQGYMGFNNEVGNSSTGYANAILVDTDNTAGTSYRVDTTTSYVVAAGFNFGFSEMVSLSLDGSYADVDHSQNFLDGNVWTVRGGVAYTPVNNLTINAHVSYAASDFETSNLRTSVDEDEWGARFRVTRSF